MKCIRLIFVCLVAALTPLAVLAQEAVSLLALIEGKALLFIDGKQQVLDVGAVSKSGVELISIDEDQVTIRHADKTQVLTLGEVAHFPDKAEPELLTDQVDHNQSVTLWASADGFFYANGTINGVPMRFLVDTGATTVTLSEQMAKKIRLDLKNGQAGIASTASGLARMTSARLNSISVGNIRLRDVTVGIVEGNFPQVPLLGMSFLGQLDMLREGRRMELRRR